jgi:hypothetical protein
MPKVKGGDVVFIPEENNFFVRIHSRSGNFMLVSKDGKSQNANEFVRLTQQQMEKLTPLSPEMPCFISAVNVSDMIGATAQIKAMGAAAVKKGLLLEVFTVPSVAMDTTTKTIVTCINNGQRDVMLATDSTQLDTLIIESVKTINTVVQERLAKHPAQKDIQNNNALETGVVERPRPEPSQTLRM